MSIMRGKMDLYLLNNNNINVSSNDRGVNMNRNGDNARTRNADLLREFHSLAVGIAFNKGDYEEAYKVVCVCMCVCMCTCCLSAL